LQNAVQVIGYLVGLPLELLIVATLLRGGYRRYPFVFAYVVADLITTVIEIRPSLGYGSRSEVMIHQFMWIYWIDERVMQILMFLVVISLVYLAAQDQRPSGSGVAGIIGGTLIFTGISFLIHYSPRLYIGQWMTPWTRDLNFAGALLDLGLWAKLISQPRKDYRLLMVSGALGIQFTGQAIGQAIRALSHSPTVRFLANILLLSMDLIFLYLWYQAFRTEPAPQPRGEPARAQPAPRET
jgi:hypothetical protein